jgi:double-stranded uracil-DNA glycosylase
VNRATARGDELTPAEIRAGVPRLRGLTERWHPADVAVLGVTAYRVAFDQPRAQVGQQQEGLAGARMWALPNPSGLNAHYQQAELTAAYRALRCAAV